MKRLTLSLLAGAALVTAAAAPAMAQPGYGGRYDDRGGYGMDRGVGGGDYRMRLDRLEDRVERGAERGDLTRREAFRLRSDIRDQRITFDRYARDGLSGWERRDMDRRLDMLSSRLRFERHDRDDRRDWDNRDRRGY